MSRRETLPLVAIGKARQKMGTLQTGRKPLSNKAGSMITCHNHPHVFTKTLFSI